MLAQLACSMLCVKNCAVPRGTVTVRGAHALYAKPGGSGTYSARGRTSGLSCTGRVRSGTEDKDHQRA